MNEAHHVLGLDKTDDLLKTLSPVVASFLQVT